MNQTSIPPRSFTRALVPTLILGLLCCALFPAALQALTVNVREAGASGDGRTLDTKAINAAIIRVSSAGGGTVLLPAGTYLVHSIRLASHVTLQIEAGTVLLAAPAPDAPGEEAYDAPEHNGWTMYKDFGHSHFHNSLIWGQDLEDVSILGPGLIYGKGLSRGNGRSCLGVGEYLPHSGEIPPDVLEADGPVSFSPRPDLVPGPFRYPNARDTLPDGVGNKAIALVNCRRVTLRDFSVLHGGHFAILATGVSNLNIDGLLIDTNRDGMDIDACNNVRISRCSVNSPWDDGICLKASYALGRPVACENVTISDCYVSGFVEGSLLDGTRRKAPEKHRGYPMGRIKLGTESNGGYRNISITNCVFEHCRGLALEEVDGGAMEDIVVSNITMRDIFNAPLFIRLGTRGRGPGEVPAGKARRIQISHVNASGVAAEHGILVMGVPGHRVEDIALSDITLRFAGGGTAADAARVFPELERGYPEPHLFGRSPAWGLFARHVSGLRIRDLRLQAETVELRPALWLGDTPDYAGQGLETSAPGKSVPNVQRD